jgi:alpha-L-fucosidase
MAILPSSADFPVLAPARPTPARLDWFLDARFGMSLHWGLYSIAGRGEWLRANERLTVEEYRPYFDAFRPDAGCALEWARLARRAGAKYVVLTTKHHDGFCLFDSKLTDYTCTHTPAGRDLVREYVEAVRGEGLRVGFYYSLVDWHHPDVPAGGDRQHPLRHHPAAKERDAKCDWSRYVDYMHGQVMELCTNYGRIDLLVFDFCYWDYVGEKWGATELVRKIRQAQPDIIINDRLGCEAIKESSPPSYAGDYDHAEQNIPRAPVLDKAGLRIPWEAWFTVNNAWSYSAHDLAWKQPVDLVRALVNCVSKGGNLMVNVGPDAKGHVPIEAHRILGQAGDWLSQWGDSIYGCGPAPFPKPEWGRYTMRGQQLFAHLLDPVIGHICLPGLRGRVKNGRTVATDAEVVITDYWNPGIQTFDRPEDIFFNFGKPVAETFPLPDRMDTVVRFDVTDEEQRRVLVRQYQEEFARALERKPF